MKKTLTNYNIAENKRLKSIDLRFKFIDAMRKFGWTLDRFGHLKKEFDNGTIQRFKLSEKSFRYEQRNKESRSKWFNKSNGCFYYKQVNIYSNGKFDVVKPKKKSKAIVKPLDSGLTCITEGKGYLLSHKDSLNEKLFTESEFNTSVGKFLKEKLPEKTFSKMIEELEKGTVINLSDGYTLKIISTSQDLLFHGGLKKTLLRNWGL